MANTLRDFDFSSLQNDPVPGIVAGLEGIRNQGIQDRLLALKEQAAQQAITDQQSIQNILQQQLGGGTPGLTEPQGIVAGEGIVPGELAITPGGSIGVEPSRIKPFTQSVADTERNLAVGLLGIKGGKEAFSKLANVFKTGREDEILAAAQEVEEIQGFALKLDRAKTRKARNKLIEDEQSRQIIDTGQIDPELLRMRNMTDDELQGEIISDLAIGDSLKKLVDNRLIPPVVKPPETRERKVGKEIVTEQFDPATGTFTELSRAPRFQPKKPTDQFVNVVNAKGEIVAQRNITTGELKKSPIATGGTGEKATFAKSPGVVVELPDGTFAQSIPVIDTRTGEVVNKISPLEGQPVSRLGETGTELTARKIRQAGGITRTKAQQTRLQTDIDDAISAAKGMAVINRSIKLMGDLQTGGFDAIRVRAKQILGIESADEAELTANLGKQILSQLRPIFGAQFTEREGATLNRIEANFGKSTKGNIRLLNQLKQIVQRAAKRGIAAAKDTDDFRSALDIQELLEFTLQEEAPENIDKIQDPSIATPTTGIPKPFKEMTLDELLAVQ